jgi:subtilase family serine protease
MPYSLVEPGLALQHTAQGVLWPESCRTERRVGHPRIGRLLRPFQVVLANLTFKLTESQQGAVTALLDQLQDPSSPSFHRWLTPEQFADRLGLSLSDVGKAAIWLGAQACTVIQRGRGGGFVGFAGTAAQVRAALQTGIHRYRTQQG